MNYIMDTLGQTKKGKYNRWGAKSRMHTKDFQYSVKYVNKLKLAYVYFLFTPTLCVDEISINSPNTSIIGISTRNGNVCIGSRNKRYE